MRKIDVSEAKCSDFRQLEDHQDEFHHKATRTLFVGNLDKSTTKESLRELFKKFGYIIVSAFVMDWNCNVACIQWFLRSINIHRTRVSFLMTS